jgi:hypothetical protein
MRFSANVGTKLLVVPELYRDFYEGVRRMPM